MELQDFKGGIMIHFISNAETYITSYSLLTPDLWQEMSQ